MLPLVDYIPNYSITRRYLSPKDFTPNFDHIPTYFSPYMDYIPKYHIPRKYFTSNDFNFDFTIDSK